VLFSSKSTTKEGYRIFFEKVGLRILLLPFFTFSIEKGLPCTESKGGLFNFGCSSLRSKNEYSVNFQKFSILLQFFGDSVVIKGERR